MKIKEVSPQSNWILSIIAEDCRAGNFDVTPYLELEAFAELKNTEEFKKFQTAGILLNGNAELIFLQIRLKLIGMSQKRLKSEIAGSGICIGASRQKLRPWHFGQPSVI
jgi:hypothetical protein